MGIKLMTYTQIQKQICEAPITWLPALLLAVVAQCLRKKVFRSPEALVRVVQKQTELEGRQFEAKEENRILPPWVHPYNDPD
jgi:hypothetical protein